MSEISAEDAVHIFEILEPYIDNPPEDQEGDPEFHRTGNYKHRYWDMVRELKDVASLASLTGYEALPIIADALESNDLSLADLGYETEDDAIDDLEPLWDNVKLGLNEAPLAAATRRAMAQFETFDTSRLSQKYQLFLNIASQLQLMRGNDYIVLPVKRLGETLNVSPMRITDFRRYAAAEGYLDPIAKACWNGNGGGVATKFFLDGRESELHLVQPILVFLVSKSSWSKSHKSHR